MPLLLREIALTLDEDETLLPLRVSEALGVAPESLGNLSVVRRGIDARRKSRILRIFSVQFEVENEEALLHRHAGNPRLQPVKQQVLPFTPSLTKPWRVLVVGMGPAGLFAAWHLARCGAEVTLVERGRSVEDRVRDVRKFRQEGVFDSRSNISFGEGGAGTFSDGKLTTRVKHPWHRQVLQTLVDCGAPEDILVDAKPHVGTDRLRLVLIRFRQKLRDLGVAIRYETRLTGLAFTAGRVRAGVLNDCEEVTCDSLVLACGHSARDTYEMLQSAGVAMEAKPFAIGLRVEHPAPLINAIQYGHAQHPHLPTAEYALTWNDPKTGRGIYSFCMCPGGEVVVASSEPGGMVVNGMSYLRRDGEWSNSALVVAVRPEDFDGRDALAGMRFQRRWEKRAYELGGGDFHAPAQNLMAFLGRGTGPIRSSCRPGVREAELAEALPAFVTTGLRRALPQFDRRMRGFVTAEASLIGIESRTSAPLRILRDRNGQSVSHAGLFPAGEGAGYAGGIMSAALDGINIAEHIINFVPSGSCR
ncbi:FAD-dependent oxidoreductase, putative [Syntrophotalea carbinolica DSM 2380]|uniref:FAD-dependent oxidoreductase, putative n=1 Tax=Syntrophotalea carbinolica (strain DSM 2380 / NBRC 103641 / GraBd1) TaxID=338963 RepID=Q3A302_SYNC1|nr:FAD-dependent monooxygenase [Syntrophotalea carbinolica]ABA89255.1 FAD-dependent oxidoreductase, putative [Syntrophotalea carbinolica DSM 2380]